MRFSVGLKDLLFGERVTITFATARRVLRKRVTAKWLEKMQAEGMFTAVPLDAEVFAVAHVLDVDRGYSTVTWKIGEDIPADVFHMLRDQESGNLFVVRTNDAGITRSFGMRRAAWEAVRDQPWAAEPARRVSAAPPSPPVTAVGLCHR